MKYNIQAIKKERELREKILTYKIQLYEGEGQLIYLKNFNLISLRSVLLCSSFISLSKDFNDCKGFVDWFIFFKDYDKKIINRDFTPPELEFFIEVNDKKKTILIKPKY